MKRNFKRTSAVSSRPFTLVFIALLGTTAPAQTKIHWQGYSWNVRSAKAEGPGPNLWGPSNIWVDRKGFLHLKISNSSHGWSCAEIWTDQDLGFGTYQCQVEGALDKLDRNIVFSMFSYAGPDGVNEIDIELAKWGNAAERNAWWTVYPNDAKGSKESHGFAINLDGTFTTQRYTWSADAVHYSMLGGHQPVASVSNLIEQWDHRPANAAHSIPQHKMPLHFNLWLFEGKPPTDGKPVEIVVRSFEFHPAAP